MKFEKDLKVDLEFGGKAKKRVQKVKSSLYVRVKVRISRVEKDTCPVLVGRVGCRSSWAEGVRPGARLSC